MKNANWLVENIKAYKDGTVGLAWDIFWQFRTKKDIFNPKNSEESSIQLFCYLCCFGMARPKTKLAGSNLKDFRSFYVNSLESFKELNKFKFESFDKVTKRDFMKHYSKIEKNLKNIKICASRTMVTKILMAITGQTPAFDTRFTNTFREKARPLPGNIYNALLKLHQKYKGEWQKDLAILPDKYKIIRDESGDIIKVPPARLIDMGFWYHDEGDSDSAKREL